MSMSIIIPARNESQVILNTIKKIINKFKKLNYEIIVINDFSTDDTFNKVKRLKNPKVKIYNNVDPGLGNAIRLGIKKVKKKYLTIFMSDSADDIQNLIEYYKLSLINSYDGIFGSRFIKGGVTKNYPKKKLFLNRIANYFIKILFMYNYNDFTNAFKCYKTKKIKRIPKLESESFNIFLELPLKFIILKNKMKIIPTQWKERKKGKTKFIIKELHSHYLKTLIDCFFYKLSINK